ncbi:fusaric acid resistance protein [Mycobacterium sp. ACS1612]|uniref:FUSC family protein n=1 Tax=Mycobacterium sp. ACS1612 TaxID=1834117 RepID=UPI0007FBAACB|nr:FUSC family protein [Mycobacterium sp. ACS1612]OBF33519.1 fusaric acid resistance protein [Mycobacterium sp. ACS1612]
MTTGGGVITPGGRGWARALRLTTPDFGAVARSLLGLLAVAAVGLASGSPMAAVWACGAAAIAGAIAMQDSPAGRVPLVIVVALQLGFVVFLGAMTAAYDPVFIAVVAVWCFAAAMQWALGSKPALVAAAGAALLVISPPVTPSPGGVLLATLLTIAAGCIQAALIAVWPPQRWRGQREALTRAYQDLAADGRRIAADPEASVGSAPLTWLREAFVDSDAIRRPLAYHGGYRLPERITATLSALRGGDGAVAAVLTPAAEFLDAIASHNRSAQRNAEYALARVDAAAESVSQPYSTVVHRFSQQLHEAFASRFGEFRRPDLIGSMRAAAAVVREHLIGTSPVLRHAVRLSVATALAVAAGRYGLVGHGHWIALTVLMVLRPETAHTYTRCVGRVAGIAMGVVVASVFTMLWQPVGLSAAVVAALFLALTYAMTRYGYLAVSAALAAAVSFLLDINPGAHGEAVEDLLFAVIIGGGLAVVAHVMWPDHGLVRLHQRAGELLKSEIDYAAMVIKAFVHELDHPAEALSSAWQRTFRARAAFEAASGAARTDSRELRRWLRSYRAALNAVTSACTALEASLTGEPSTALTPEFIAAVDDYVDALRGGPPTAATPWTVDIDELTVANQQVRQQGAGLAADNAAARVLVAEIAAITRSLADIAASREPTAS